LLEQQQLNFEKKPVSRALKILIVEDEPELLALYRLQIESWEPHYEVITAKDGYEGLLKIGQYQPDLIISDLLMPEMDGFRMIHSIKNRQETKDIQVVVVTLLDSEEIENNGGLPGDVLVLNKPIPFEFIRELVEKKTGVQA